MYIVSYDITNDKRRRKVAKVMENYGRRVQYSVFECTLDRAQYNRMYKELCNLMTLTDSEINGDNPDNADGEDDMDVNDKSMNDKSTARMDRDNVEGNITENETIFDDPYGYDPNEGNMSENENDAPTDKDFPLADETDTSAEGDDTLVDGTDTSVDVIETLADRKVPYDFLPEELTRIPFLQSGPGVGNDSGGNTINDQEERNIFVSEYRKALMSMSPDVKEKSKTPRKRKGKSKPKREEGTIRIYSVCKTCMQKTVQIGVQEPVTFRSSNLEKNNRPDIIVIG